VVISIYPALAAGVKELRAEARIPASGPFDSPAIIGGRLLTLPEPAALGEIRDVEVLFEGEIYRFSLLQADGSFELHKAW
jgi:hypothetical protein